MQGIEDDTLKRGDLVQWNANKMKNVILAAHVMRGLISGIAVGFR